MRTAVPVNAPPAASGTGRIVAKAVPNAATALAAAGRAAEKPRSRAMSAPTATAPAAVARLVAAGRGRKPAAEARVAVVRAARPGPPLADPVPVARRQAVTEGAVARVGTARRIAAGRGRKPAAGTRVPAVRAARPSRRSAGRVRAARCRIVTGGAVARVGTARRIAAGQGRNRVAGAPVAAVRAVRPSPRSAGRARVARCHAVTTTAAARVASRSRAVPHPGRAVGRGGRMPPRSRPWVSLQRRIRRRTGTARVRRVAPAPKVLRAAERS